MPAEQTLQELSAIKCSICYTPRVKHALYMSLSYSSLDPCQCDGLPGNYHGLWPFVRSNPMESMSQTTDPIQRKAEGRVFLLLTVVLAPVLAVAIVGGYGFMIWIYQMFAGPPTA